MVAFNPFYFNLNFSTILLFRLHICTLQTQTQFAYLNSNLLSLSQAVLHKNQTFFFHPKQNGSFFFPPQQNGSDLKTCVTTCGSHASALLCKCKMTALWSKNDSILWVVFVYSHNGKLALLFTCSTLFLQITFEDCTCACGQQETHLNSKKQPIYNSKTMTQT